MKDGEKGFWDYPKGHVPNFQGLVQWVECSPIIRETLVQSQVASYQRLKKWYLIPPFLTLSNTRYVSRVKWSNPGKGVAPSPTPRCTSYWKGGLLVALDYSRQLYLQDRYHISKWIWSFRKEPELTLSKDWTRILRLLLSFILFGKNTLLARPNKFLKQKKCPASV